MISDARAKGKDANIKRDLASIRNQAGLYQDSNGNFSTFALGSCPTAAGSMFYDSPEIRGLIVDVRKYVVLASDVKCSANNSSWAVSAKLQKSGTGYWCADANGASKEIPGPITSFSC